jgi:hypothetical protein
MTFPGIYDFMICMHETPAYVISSFSSWLCDAALYGVEVIVRASRFFKNLLHFFLYVYAYGCAK